jgi:response regulator RpfG family c-di-GMP phosphodiesterase
MKHLFILVSLVIVGCASRKVDVDIKKKDSTTVEITKEITTKKTDSTSNNLVIDKSETDELIITPIDSTKEIVVNGKKYFNAVLKYKKVRNNTYNNNKVKVSKIEDKAVKTNNRTSVQTKNKTKKIETNNTILYLFFLIIFIILLLVGNKLRKIYL